jgi:aminobenzoyl-glutamate utilization protein B
LYDWIDANERLLRDAARRIWEKPERPLAERMAAGLHAEILEREGFRIRRDIPDLPTAFTAEYGSGSPVIGITGEYDALPRLSQKLSAVREPAEEGGPGHGCGHNLLGVGGVGAALAVKQALASGEIAGTVRYYGCPAEEVLVGKVFMVKAGLFDDLDACLSWHPASMNKVWGCSFLALNSAVFHFRGVSAHAAAAPEMGRSALKGVELMNIGAHYLREHMPEKARMHCTITNGGGEPNVVPAEASVWYYVRAPKREQVEELFARLRKVAEGAALMTETEVRMEFLAGCYEILPNQALGVLLHRNMKEAGTPKFTDEDEAFAAALAATFPPGQKKKGIASYYAPEELEGMVLHREVVEANDKGQVMSGSIDLGDVSWKVPFAQFIAAAWPVGTAAHSWQATAASGSEIGMKAMLFASKALAGAVYDLMTPTGRGILAEAKAEFSRATRGFVYRNPIPEGVKPKVP